MTRTDRIIRWAPLFATASLGLALSACSRDDIPTAPGDPGADRTSDESAVAGVRTDLRAAGLRVTTADPDQEYVVEHADAWFRRSMVTEAEYFDLVIRNETGRRATGLELLVTVPADLGPGGWYILLDGVFLSSIEDFPHTALGESHYPPLLPHLVFEPQGNGRYYLLSGPETLEAGAEWVIPIEMSRGVAEEFKAHFVAASANRLYTSPLTDVTAQPPINNSGGGGE
jgi:hypothetical protein